MRDFYSQLNLRETLNSIDTAVVFEDFMQEGAHLVCLGTAFGEPVTANVLPLR